MPSWDQALYYVPDNEVVFQGVTYVCVEANQNDKPPSPSWRAVATGQTALKVEGVGLQLEGNPADGYTLKQSVVGGVGVSLSAVGDTLVINNTAVTSVEGGTGLKVKTVNSVVTLENTGVVGLEAGKGIIIEGDKVKTISAVPTVLQGGEGVSIEGDVVSNTAPFKSVSAVGLLATLTSGCLSLVSTAVQSVVGSKGVKTSVADGVATVSVDLKAGAGIVVDEDTVSTTAVLSVEGDDGVVVSGGQKVVVKNTAPFKSVETKGALDASLDDGVLRLCSRAVEKVVGGEGISVNGEVVSNEGVLSVAVGEGLSATGSKDVLLTNTAPLYSVSAITPISATLTTGHLSLSSSGIYEVRTTSPLCVETADGVATLTNEGVVSVVAGDGISVSDGQKPVIKNEGVLSLAPGKNIQLSAFRGDIVISSLLPPLPPVDASLKYYGEALGVANKQCFSVVAISAQPAGGLWLDTLQLAPGTTGFLWISGWQMPFVASSSYFADFNVSVAMVDGDCKAEEIEWGWSQRPPALPLAKATNACALQAKEVLRLGLTPVAPKDIVYPASSVGNFLSITNKSAFSLCVKGVGNSILYGCG